MTRLPITRQRFSHRTNASTLSISILTEKPCPITINKIGQRHDTTHVSPYKIYFI